VHITKDNLRRRDMSTNIIYTEILSWNWCIASFMIKRNILVIDRPRWYGGFDTEILRELFFSIQPLFAWVASNFLISFSISLVFLTFRNLLEYLSVNSYLSFKSKWKPASLLLNWIELNLLTNSQWRQAKAWRAHWQRKNTEKKWHTYTQMKQ